MAAGATYEPIETYTTTGSQNTHTFTGIPSTYTDLQLVISFNAGGGTFSTRVGNGSIDTGANYSITRLWGDGSSASSNRYTNETYFTGNITVGASTTNAIINYMNYSNTTTFKTALNRFNDAGAIVFAIVGLWRNTAAIDQLRIFTTSGTFGDGTTFSLYGIKSA